MNAELNDCYAEVITLLDELEVVDILRIHTPPARRFLLDRLENKLAVIARCEEEDDDLYFLDGDDEEDAAAAAASGDAERRLRV